MSNVLNILRTPLLTNSGTIFWTLEYTLPDIGGGPEIDAVIQIGTVQDLTTTPATFTDLPTAITYYDAIIPAQLLSMLNTMAGSTYWTGYAISQYTPHEQQIIATIPVAQIQSDWNQTLSSALDFIKNKPSIPSTARTTSSFTPALVGTGATGTQASSSKDSTVRATFTTSTTVTLGGSPASLVTAYTCSTNSATEANWTAVGGTGGSQPTTLSITVGQQVTNTGQIIFDIPAGYYFKFENTGSGTHAETVVSGQKTIYG